MSIESVDLKELDFNDLSVVEIKIPISGESYVLREASGDAACKYRNSMLACTQLGPEGKPSSVRGMADCEPLLVSMCLFKVDEKGNMIPVPIVKVRSWPDRVQKKLAETIKKISNMENDTETVETLEAQIVELEKKIEKLKSKDAALKNEQASTEDGST